MPKFIPDADGSLGERNGIKCARIEEKMGIHGNATCVMDLDGARGWMVSQPNRGLQAMFVMMNAARIGVGVQTLGLMETAYQNSLAYAKERIQSRSLTGPKQPDKPADPIIVHPDVRRMLLTQKAYTEGCRAFALWLALQADRAAAHPDEEERKEAERPADAADAGGEGLHHRQRLPHAPTWRCRSSAAMATSANGAWSSTCAMPGST